MPADAIQWGNAAEWVAAVGTVLTLGLGVLILWREARDNRRRHAARVAAWIDVDSGSVSIHNGAEEPVTRVMVALFAVPDHYTEPRSGQDGDPWVMDWEWLGPGERRTESPTPVDWQNHLFPPKVRLEYTDMTGRRWLRNEQGQLSRKLTIPFRQDWGKVWRWKRDARQTAKARGLYTRWRWPYL